MLTILNTQLFRGVILVARSKLRPLPLSGSRLQEREGRRSTQDNGVGSRGKSTVVTDKAVKKALEAVAKKANSSQTLASNRSLVPDLFSRRVSQISGDGSAPGQAAKTQGLTPSDLTPTDVEGFLRAKPFEEIPGPTGIHQSIPFAGTRLLYYPFSNFRVENVGDLLCKLQAVYGSIFRVKIGAEWIVLIDSLQDIERVVHAAELEGERGVVPTVKSQLAILEKLPKRVQDPALAWWYGGCKFSKKFLTAINHHLKSERLVSRILQDDAAVADDFVTVLDKMQSSPEEVQKLFYRFAFESVGQTCFNKRLGLLAENYHVDEQKQKLVESYRTVERCLSESITGTRVLHLLFEDPFAKRFREAKQCIDSCEQELIREASAEALNGKGSASAPNVENRSLLINLLDDKTLDEQEIADAMHALMTYCGDAVSSALQMVLYSLATNEDVQVKLYAELQKALGADFNINPTSLQSAEYLNAVLQESLRLHYPLPCGGRIILNSNIVLSGFLIPSGTQIIINTPRTTKSPVLFDHPYHFLPERWTEGSAKDVPPLACLPFCARQNVDTTQWNRLTLQVALVKILQRYKVDLPGSYHKKNLETIYTPFLSPKEPLPFSFTPRKGPPGPPSMQPPLFPLEPPK